MTSRLATILKDELAAQRVFLSSDEETALSLPASYDDETNLAWDRIRHRKLIFFSAMRDRYIRDRRPAGEWQRMIDDEEQAAGGPTFISQIATQVLEWALRTSDRAAMMVSFAATAQRWLGITLILLGLYGWSSGATAEGTIVAIAGAVFFVGGRIAHGIATRRASSLIAEARGAHRKTQDVTG